MIVARAEDEWALLHRFAELRGDAVELLTPERTRERAIQDPRLLGSACGNDLRINSRRRPALAAHLAEAGVEFRFRTNVTGVESGLVRTSRGGDVCPAGCCRDRARPGSPLHAARGRGRFQRCLLHMLETDAPAGGNHFDPVILTGTAVMRWRPLAAPGGRQHPRAHAAGHPGAARRLRERQDVAAPERAARDRRHAYAHTHAPFKDESLGRLLLREFTQLLGAPLTVRRRWHSSTRPRRPRTSMCMSRTRRCSSPVSPMARA